jgi:putative addiction module component (TIGR02574 family)
MTQRTQELLQKALSLTDEERAELAASLMDSLESGTDSDIDIEIAWQNEVARRLTDLDSGRVKTTDWVELRGRLASRLRDGRKNS